MVEDGGVESVTSPDPAAAPGGEVDIAELEFEERLAVLASQVRPRLASPSPSSNPAPSSVTTSLHTDSQGCSRERRGRVLLRAKKLASVYRHASATASVRCRRGRDMRRCPSLPPRFKIEGFLDKDDDELWWSPKFWALCLQDLKEVSWPPRKQVAQTLFTSQVAFFVIIIVTLRVQSQAPPQPGA